MENSILIILLVAILLLLKVLLKLVSHYTVYRLKLMSSNNNFFPSLPSVGVYSDSDGELIFLLQGQQGGVTHVMFSPDGAKLYSGGRKVHLVGENLKELTVDQHEPKLSDCSLYKFHATTMRLEIVSSLLNFLMQCLYLEQSTVSLGFTLKGFSSCKVTKMLGI